MTIRVYISTEYIIVIVDKTYRVISGRHIFDIWQFLELELSGQYHTDGTQLNIGKLLTNATMAPSSRRQVGASSSFADKTITIVNLLVIPRGVDTIPSVGFPIQWLGEVLGGSCSESGG